MPTFFARRYRRDIRGIGRREKVISACIVVALCAIVAAFAIDVTGEEPPLFSLDARLFEAEGMPANGHSASQANPTGPMDMRSRSGNSAGSEYESTASATSNDGMTADTFPAPESELWQPPRKVDRFSADNLYVKINGRADAYLDFNVVGLAYGAYADVHDPHHTIDVYWYDMGSPENAFGIYRAELTPEGEAVSIGREGYQIGGAVFFFKGSSYVQVLPNRLDEADARAALAIAQALADRIEDAGDDVSWAPKLFPRAGRVADSFEYIASDAFSLGFLSEVYTQEHEFDGARLELFIHRAADADSALALFNHYVAFFEKYGKVVRSDPDPNRRLVIGEVAGMIDAVFVVDRYLGGVAGAEAIEPAETAARGFRDSLEGDSASDG